MSLVYLYFEFCNLAVPGVRGLVFNRLDLSKIRTGERSWKSSVNSDCSPGVCMAGNDNILPLYMFFFLVEMNLLLMLG
jgi:hypothetical protein